MTELSPETRNLLDAARDAHAPPAGARDRVRARMMSDLARSVPPKPVAARWFQSSLVKLVGAGVVVAGLGAALRMKPSPAPASRPVVAHHTQHVTQTPVPPAVPVAETHAPAPVEPIAQPVLPEAPPRSRAAASHTTEDDLTAEIALLRQARAALTRNDNATALDLAERYQTRFPQGSMAEDAAALKVIALCQSGLTERARMEAERFFMRWPRSLHGSRVRTACHHGANTTDAL